MTKYDNDGYPDIMPEPTVTIPRAQHEALMAAVKALTVVYRISLREHDAWYLAGDALEACRAAGSMEDQSGTP